MFSNLFRRFLKLLVRICFLCMMSSIHFVYADNVTNSSDPVLYNQFARWAIYQYQDAGQKICYTASTPVTADPVDGVRHGLNFLMVAPIGGVAGESYHVELAMDYPLDEQVMVSVEVVGKNAKGRIFSMIPQRNRAAFKNREDDRVLVNMMKMGRDLVVSAKSQRGTNTRYVYSLNGITDALNNIRVCQK
ncbi:MAG: hypothetical protein EU981_03580 [Candidatus Liberibacter ctenarytainae]|uniref:Uncharacterized protein n=1 Tax=Candidatus Liberibacter ctenarytainae TaxID=2020335 RepID=A0A937AFI8_9HYPH|nr:hypothetical protein [Candidatus Liberibacter ctenarytainae]